MSAVGVVALLALGMVAGWLMATETMVHHSRSCTTCRVQLDRVAKCRRVRS